MSHIWKINQINMTGIVISNWKQNITDYVKKEIILSTEPSVENYIQNIFCKGTQFWHSSNVHISTCDLSTTCSSYGHCNQVGGCHICILTVIRWIDLCSLLERPQHVNMSSLMPFYWPTSLPGNQQLSVKNHGNETSGIPEVFFCTWPQKLIK